jgi:cation transport regulator ChaC
MPYVFGYGSLVDAHPQQIECHLEGHRRSWTVAMDNRVDLPRYKYFVDPATGSRPAVCVTFLNIEPDPGGAVNGIAFPATDAAIAALDERERNYARCDVTSMLREDVGETVYAFVGRPDARERFVRASDQGRAVVSEAYLGGVLDGFARLGELALEAFGRSTDAPPCPVVALQRVDLP